MIYFNNKGFTLLELIISAGLAMIVVCISYNVFILSSRSFITQQEIAVLEQNARAAIELIVREIRNMSTIDNIVFTENDSSITFYSIRETGTPTTCTYNSLIDLQKSWIKNEWQHDKVVIIDGTATNQLRTIVSNTNNQLFISPEWSKLPDNTSLYQIRTSKVFSRDEIKSELKYTVKGISSTFASDISGLTIKGYDDMGYVDCNVSNINILEIILKARVPICKQPVIMKDRNYVSKILFKN